MTRSFTLAHPGNDSGKLYNSFIWLYNVLDAGSNVESGENTAGQIDNLMATAEDLGRAMGSLVNAVTSDDEFDD
jgi:hypothetical protein